MEVSYDMEVKQNNFIIPKDLKKIPINYLVATKLLKHVIKHQDDPIITYGDLAAKIDEGFNPQNLRYPLGVISSVCIENDFPPISSIVVYKNTGLPGDGFYIQFYSGVNWQKDMQKIFEKNKLAIINCTLWKELLNAIEN